MVLDLTAMGKTAWADEARAVLAWRSPITSDVSDWLGNSRKLIQGVDKGPRRRVKWEHSLNRNIIRSICFSLRRGDKRKLSIGRVPNCYRGWKIKTKSGCDYNVRIDLSDIGHEARNRQRDVHNVVDCPNTFDGVYEGNGHLIWVSDLSSGGLLCHSIPQQICAAPCNYK